MKNILTFICFLLCFQTLASDFFSGRVEELKWKDLDVVYIEDERFPTYTLNIYFADGALSDGSIKGVTEAALQFLTLGTRRFSRKDIAGNLEFYGASYGSSVTHEYSSYSVSGLSKDITPTMKKICHLFQDATYPKRDLRKEKKRILDSLDNLVGNPGALASMAFREESLAGTPYSYPVSGKRKDIRQWDQKILKDKLSYLNNEVKKKIYITGPKSVLDVKNVINEDCGWKGQGSFVRKVSYEQPKTSKKPQITLVPVPQANQAQIRIGTFLGQDDIGEDELMNLASHYLGGGFTSRLMRVLRVENGLTYGVGTFAGAQKQYGRAGISTSTKVETVEKLLEKTRETVKKAIAGEIEKSNFERAKGSLAGSYPFGFESTTSFLNILMQLDHRGLPYSTLTGFPEKVMAFKEKELSRMAEILFRWEHSQITVVGPRSLKKTLQKFGEVKVKSYKNFL